MSSSASKAKLPRWIDYQPISDVKGAERNPKQHSPELGSAIDRFGFADGVILDERTGRLVAGHGRLERLKLMQEEGQDAPDGIRVLKGKWLLPVQRGWSSRSDKEAEAFLVAHNRLTEAGGWDDRALFELLEQFEGDDLAGLGVDETYLGELQERVDELNEEDLPEGEDTGGGEPPADPVSKRGEVYALGPHRLMCGDCRDAVDWDKLVTDEKVNVCVTSPPYASQRKYDEESGFKPIKPDDYVQWWEPLQALVAQYLADDGSFFVNIKEHCEDGQRSLYVKDLTLAHVREWGWLFVDEFCWKKNSVPGKWPNRFKNAWEPIFHFSRSNAIKLNHYACATQTSGAFSYSPDNPKSKTGFFSDRGVDITKEGMAIPSNVLEIGAESRQTDSHSAPYPVGLPAFFVKAFSDEGDVVLDPFLGSGTTLIAAARQGRKCYGMEISPAYCDVIRKRWGDWARSADVDPGPDAL